LRDQAVAGAWRAAAAIGVGICLTTNACRAANPAAELPPSFDAVLSNDTIRARYRVDLVHDLPADFGATKLVLFHEREHDLVFVCYRRSGAVYQRVGPEHHLVNYTTPVQTESSSVVRTSERTTRAVFRIAPTSKGCDTVPSRPARLSSAHTALRTLVCHTNV